MEVTEDPTDRLLERWSTLQPGFDLEASQVVDRIARVALGMSRWQDEAFASHGLNRGDVGVLSALRGTKRPSGSPRAGCTGCSCSPLPASPAGSTPTTKASPSIADAGASRD
ncbi:hypothetical protein [Candidatus Nephthysia bennettiae]|uniref:Uncharacterized protein n=1 Tax=Candidatus Nephthysia bennettiae TaxID=3127016 RepID=A0A934K658_9BACT|nr:hypothetical protein [Candidatus Dormibacteraeota bacterium]